MSDNKPEWYSRLKSGPLRERTFTEEMEEQIMKRVQEEGLRVSRFSSARRSWLVIGGCVAAASLLLLLFQSGVTDFFAPRGADPLSNPKPPLESPSPTLTPTENPDVSESSAYVKGEVGAFAMPEYNPMERPRFIARPGVLYNVKERKNDQALIAADGQEGWVFEWYLTVDERDRSVSSVEPYVMLVTGPTAFNLYPKNSDKLGDSMLESDKVVRVTKEYEDWVNVEMITYDQPYYGDRWVMKKHLEHWDAKKAKEGRLRPGGVVLTEDGEVNELADYSYIFIEEVMEDGRYRISAAGGLTGYIQPDDFIPNPFLPAPWETWSLISAAEEKAYEQYVESKEEALLEGFSPITIFKFYVMASEAGDYETVYGLYMKDDGHEVPSFKTFINDIAKDQNVLERSQQMWKELRENYSIYEEITEDEALIRITNRKDSQDMKGFSLIKNKDGIWKVAWLPMQ